MSYSEGQKCIEACGKPLPADDEAAAFCLEAGIRPLRVAAESPYVARPASAAVLAKPVSVTVPGYLAGSITGAGFGAVPFIRRQNLGTLTRPAGFGGRWQQPVISTQGKVLTTFIVPSSIGGEDSSTKII